MNHVDKAKRRTVLKTVGTGILGSAVLTGSATAHEGGDHGTGKGKGNNYGNGNGIGAFLNEEALYKPSPVWDSGIANRTGQDEVNVIWSNLTDVINPEGEVVPGPWGIEPRVVKVSPGTDVTWTWYDGPGALNVHHLVSYFDPPYEDPFPNPFAEGEEDHEHEHPGGEDEFFAHEDLGESFTHTFDERGTYLYFCIPHGLPKGITIEGAPEEFPNLFGQRGAVIVAGD